MTTPLTTADRLARLTDTEPAPLKPCAWCTPRAELDRLARLFPNQLSHGCCPRCARLMLEAR